jgi:hypothetical protein
MSAFIDRAIRFVFASALSTLNLHNLSGLDRFGGVLNEPVRECANVHKAVLVDADVDECAELGDIGDDAFEDHFWLIVGELAEFFVEPWSDKLLARIAARPAHLPQNVLNCEPTCVDFAGSTLVRS